MTHHYTPIPYSLLGYDPTRSLVNLYRVDSNSLVKSFKFSKQTMGSVIKPLYYTYKPRALREGILKHFYN